MRANPHPWVGKPLRCRREEAAWGRGDPGEPAGVSALLPAARAPGCRQGAQPPSCSRLCEGAAVLGFLCGEHVGVPCRAVPSQAVPCQDGALQVPCPLHPTGTGGPCLHRAGAQPCSVPGAEAGCSHPPPATGHPGAGARFLWWPGLGCCRRQTAGAVSPSPATRSLLAWPWFAVPCAVARPVRALLRLLPGLEATNIWPPAAERPPGGRCPLSPLPTPGHLGRCAARWGLKVRGEGVIRG